jgi:hypothetical protein
MFKNSETEKDHAKTLFILCILTYYIKEVIDGVKKKIRTWKIISVGIQACETINGLSDQTALKMTFALIKDKKTI